MCIVCTATWRRTAFLICWFRRTTAANTSESIRSYCVRFKLDDGCVDSARARWLPKSFALMVVAAARGRADVVAIGPEPLTQGCPRIDLKH
mmetsp:Transcript_11974/g.38563  ORF Transcript_11974/g.38563 Transcript_11974/m.38563 type:complete len:91 (+) Transcript_11974:1244-1516(+)